MGRWDVGDSLAGRQPACLRPRASGGTALCVPGLHLPGTPKHQRATWGVRAGEGPSTQGPSLTGHRGSEWKLLRRCPWWGFERQAQIGREGLEARRVCSKVRGPRPSVLLALAPHLPLLFCFGPGRPQRPRTSSESQDPFPVPLPYLSSAGRGPCAHPPPLPATHLCPSSSPHAHPSHLMCWASSRALCSGPICLGSAPAPHPLLRDPNRSPL